MLATAGVAIAVSSPSDAEPPLLDTEPVPMLAPSPAPARTLVLQTSFFSYAKAVYRREKISKRALRRLDLMRGHAASELADRNMLAFQRRHGHHRKTRIVAHAASTIMAQLSVQERCILRAEGGTPTTTNSSGHMGIGQWDQATWIAHGGGRYSPTPIGATYTEQLIVLHSAYQRFGCSPWCPYEHGQC